MKQTKVCHLTSVHIPFDTRIFYKECISLVKAGYEVHLIAPHDRDDVVEGIQIHPFPRIMSKLKRILFSPYSMVKKARAVDADIYHIHDPELIPAALILRLLGRKVLYDVHEDYPETIPRKKILPRPFRKPAGYLIKMLERFVSGYYTAVIVATPALYERFRLGAVKTVAIHNYPFISRRRHGIWINRENSVCYIGSIAENRCIHEMLTAIGLARKKTAVSLTLAGNFTSDSLERTISASPEFAWVDYHGFLNRTEVESHMDRVKAGLILVHPEPRYMVSYPTKLFEYMAAGLPVIASDFPLWRNIIDDVRCGILVDPLDPVAIAQAVVTLLENPEEAEAMGERGRTAVERNYRWDKEEEKLLGLYRELLR